jgi:hypothetical protein
VTDRPDGSGTAEPGKRAPGRETHWLYRPENLPRLWLAMILILLLALLPELFVHHHPHFAEHGFTWDAAFGFYAWYGFLSCAGMVALAKILGIFLKRRDSYYDE